ncbi:MAG: oligoendopeptidase F family protein, partial [Clostridiales bacterium]|nr:oligoendopeptidase F family protein [Clostridiales bacterium]
MNKSIKTRDQIESKYKWNIEAMYPDESQWEEDYKKAEKLGDEFLSFAGSLSESPEKMLEAFRSKDEIWQTVEKVYVYARMKSDEDTRIAKYLSMMDKSQALVARTAAKLSFFTPELLEISEEKLLDFVSKSEGLKLYEHVIRQILRQKAHVLSKAEEKIIAKFSQLTSATNDIFNMINNADIKFGTIEDEEGDSVEVTHGRYIRFMESPVRRVRKDAFERLYAAYEAQKNTLAATYNYNTKTDVVTSNIRKYSSSLEAALQGDNIKTEVYDNLIDVVNRSLPLIHRYVDLRKNALKLDEVHMYDLYAPLAENPMDEIKYEDALGMVEKGLAPLGDDYIRNMKMGFESGWIDVFENEGKRSGAYSFGSYDSMPYILLNYNGRLKDVFTIAHEVGHSMHSYYTRKTQPFIYGGHSIFTAEVASTVNENLLMRDLLEKEDDPKVRKYLLNIYIEDFRATLFRQTMFAEFEK